MRKVLAASLVLVSVYLVGCGGSGSAHENAVKESISVMNEMAAALESSKTAAEAKPKLEAAATKFKAVKKQIDALPKTTKDVDEALEKKYKPQMEEAQKRMMSAMGALAAKDPLGIMAIGEALKDIK